MMENLEIERNPEERMPRAFSARYVHAMWYCIFLPLLGE